LSDFEKRQEQRYKAELEQKEKMHSERMDVLKALIEAMKK
jgi:hypothetical protein